jgi:hypothetical protein
MLEKRQEARVLAQDLHADICVMGPDSEILTTMKGEVVDMSYSGIKIKLSAAMPNIPSQSKITILLSNPNLTTPVTIKGMVRYLSKENDCGIAFANEQGKSELGKFLFECVRKIPNDLS